MPVVFSSTWKELPNFVEQFHLAILGHNNTNKGKEKN